AAAVIVPDLDGDRRRCAGAVPVQRGLDEVMAEETRPPDDQEPASFHFPEFGLQVMGDMFEVGGDDVGGGFHGRTLFADQTGKRASCSARSLTASVSGSSTSS